MTDQATSEATENIQDVSEQASIENVVADVAEVSESIDLLNSGNTTPEVEASEATTDVESEEQESEPTGAPDSYEFERHEDFDPSVLGVFSEVAKELDMPQASAQKILDSVAPKIQEKLDNDVRAMRESWENDSRSDPEIGGKGNAEVLTRNIAIANKSIDRFGDAAYRQLLQDTGIGSHPAVIRMHMKAGKAISEDTVVTSSDDLGSKPIDLLSHAELADQIYTN